MTWFYKPSLTFFPLPLPSSQPPLHQNQAHPHGLSPPYFLSSLYLTPPNQSLELETPEFKLPHSLDPLSSPTPHPPDTPNRLPSLTMALSKKKTKLPLP